MPPGLDPVNVIAGVIKGQLPSLSVQQCLMVAYEVWGAIREFETVQNFQASIPPAPPMP